VVICAVGELKRTGPVIVNVKCDLQPGRVQHVVSKVRWSVVLWGLQAVSFLYNKQDFKLSAFEQ
jgi:hypothetical protein